MKRLDQDIHFILNGIPILMQLDTTAPIDIWFLRPENPEHTKGDFASKVQSVFEDDSFIGFHFSDDHATIECYNTSIASNIFASLPEWDGDSLSGLIGAIDLIDFLLCLQVWGEIKEFRRGDGRIIELDINKLPLYCSSELENLSSGLDKLFSDILYPQK